MTGRGRDDALADIVTAEPGVSATNETVLADSSIGSRSEAEVAEVAEMFDRLRRGRTAPLAGPGPVLPTVDAGCYEILGEHGRGGLGRILRARDLRTGRIVAIKEMLRGTPDAAARFAREAMVTANLMHPAIVPVYEVGCWPTGQPFYAMKLVSGHSLEQAIRRAKTPAQRTALLPHAIQVADALAYAHDQGIIHRDLKPANVLVGDYGETVVIDWGLAKRVDERSENTRGGDPTGSAGGAPRGNDSPSEDVVPAASLGSRIGSDNASATATGEVLGTPTYMAPEQARGESIDERADVYAIGALLYHVLGGVPPYYGSKTVAEVVDRVAAGPPKPLRELAELPVELVTIVEHAMAHAVADRYPTARALADELARFRSGQLVRSHSYTARQLVARWLRRHRIAVAVAVAAVAVIAVVAIGAISNVVSARDGAEASRETAEQRRREADQRLIALHTELGRRELIDDEPGRAFPYLANAFRHDPSNPVIALLLGRAIAANPVELAYPIASLPKKMSSSDDGTVVVARTVLGTAEVWSVAHGSKIAVAGDVVVAHDGSRVASWSGGTIRIVDLAGRIVADASLAPDAVEFVQFGADDRTVVAVTAGGVVSTRDVATLAERSRLATEQDSATVDPTGRFAISVDHQGDTRIWRISDGRRTVAARCHTPAGWWGVEFARDGSTAATTNQSELCIWDLATGALRFKLDRKVNGFAVSNLGTRLVTLDTSTTVWDLATGKLIATIARGRSTQSAVDLSADGTRVAIATVAGEIGEWDAATGTRLAAFGGHNAFVAGVRYANRGRNLISTTSGNVAVWRSGAPNVVRAIDHAPRAARAAYLDAARVVTVGRPATGRIVDAATGRIEAELAHQGPPRYVAPSPDRALIATVGDDAIRLWSRDGKPVRTLPGHTGSVAMVDWSPDGTRIATVGDDRTARVWRIADGIRLLNIGLPSQGRAIAWSPDGTRLLIGMDTNLGSLRDAVTGSEVAAIPLAADGVAVDVRFSPDGARAVIATGRPSAPVISARDGTLLFEATHSAHILGVAWSPDGATLVTAAVDGSVRTWDTTGKSLLTIPIDRGVIGLAVSPDGHILATGGEDETVRLWDLSTGRQLAELRRAAGVVFHLVWRPDGRQLAIAGAGPDIGLWDIAMWNGSLDELAAIERCNAWQLADDALAPAPQRCGR